MKLIQDHFPHVRFSQRDTYYMWAESCIKRKVKITAVHNLMQGSVRDSSISIVENIPQDKKLL